MAVRMDPQQLPAHAGDCCYCEQDLYEDAPLVKFPDGLLAHVACEIDARRRWRTHPCWPHLKV